MPPTPATLAETALAFIRSQGAASSADIQARLRVSQPTVSRTLAPLLRDASILKVGAARSQMYVAPRHVERVGAEVPVIKVDANGDAAPFGRIVPLQGGRCWMDEEEGPSALHDGLPWFLADMRPQGFIGRAFAHGHPELGLPANPDHWRDDDVLQALALCGEDLPGNLVVGGKSFRRFQSIAARPAPQVSPTDYPAMADSAMQGTLPGSSAGGEQPKFCTVRDGRQVIVKFSPSGASPADRRSRDLLVCEHLALRTLQEAGVAAATTRLFIEAGRVFLEVERFDRTARGRIAMVSLMAYDAQHIGKIDNWAATANRMVSRGLLRADDAQTLRFLEAFGRLIGNTDRHYGNISLLIENGAWRLAPAYDVLPTLYAPTSGELPPRDLAAGDLAPTVETLGEWQAARQLASVFWRTVDADERITAPFRAIARKNAQAIPT
ncbi:MULTISPECIES: type II toxin-antitoxin system HipA family toxin YjjJ [unclassified Variovorax]|uniref:type II toxin-antitoxin system HipA family toxin YjjJ n=1 Tax=unclassified Variovorax TaxID=663243 RepID=UPI000D13847C|nr:MULTISPECIES: type II toxin-antitoxin system HipA family toxin YjjJ [unclassified Variovorax]AVQ80230.1 transcriptional regulator [Variovorax sp. PMC12]QRY30364.1 type II toxin-antitoxin system HipA family toxin YjjJ [Variovorax sp. PDNC026]